MQILKPVTMCGRKKNKSFLFFTTPDFLHSDTNLKRSKECRVFKHMILYIPSTILIPITLTFSGISDAKMNEPTDIEMSHLFICHLAGYNLQESK